MTEPQTFGDRLRELRSQKRLTAKALGIIAGVSEDSAEDQVYRWERSDKPPLGDTVARLAQALDTTTDYLLLGKKAVDATTEPDKLAEYIHRNVNTYRDRKRAGAGREELASRQGDVEYGVALLFRKAKDPSTAIRNVTKLLLDREELPPPEEPKAEGRAAGRKGSSGGR